MKQFLTKFFKFLLVGFVPAFVLLAAGYFYYDPFKVLYKYNDYSYHPAEATKNRDYVSTEMFLKNYPKYHYNSFIFGSSRTMAFRPSVWRKYLPEGSSPFLFDGAGESVYGIYTKLRYLDSINAKIGNALILIDRDWSFKNYQNHDGYMFIKHPAVSGESWFAFHKKFIGIYFEKIFLKNFYEYKITGQYKDRMYLVLMNFEMAYDTVTNETNMTSVEKEISEDAAKFYAKRKNIFYKQKGETVDSVDHITENHMPLLNGIKAILEKHKTNYKIVLDPVYDQMKFTAHDMNILRGLFGGHIYDFTGKNKFTDSITNFYEVHHFRPIVGDAIMDSIYKKQ